MKTCPICSETYTDETLNFCLKDGATLSITQKDDTPPTIFMNQPRQTNPNWTNYQPPTYQNQQIDTPRPFGMQGQNQFQVQGQDQTLPTISLVLGILSILLICCYGGIYLGVPAIVLGYLGMNNVNNDPNKYGGKGMAMAGMIIGIGTLLVSVFFFFIGILSSLAK